MPQNSNLHPSIRSGGGAGPARARRLAAAIARLMAAALVASVVSGCGNLIETASCKESCEDTERQCLLYGAVANQTPSNDPAPGSVLFLNCRSAFYVCRASCDEGATRL